MAERPFQVELPITVRGYDIDFVGIVSNIVYVRWLEDLRTALLSTYFPFHECVRVGVSPVILRTAVEYHRAIRMLDDPTGRLWVTAMGKTRWEVAAEFVVGDTIMASASQQGCFLRLDNGRPAPVPEGLAAPWRTWEETGRIPAAWGS